MCGRFVLKTLNLVLEEFDVQRLLWTPNFNVAPTTDIPVIRAAKDHAKRELALMHWGLIPAWAKDAKIGNRMINARAETLALKPVFRTALERRRCLIPADGFYKWKKSAKSKQPYYIQRRDHHLLAFAGLWERWKDPAGHPVDSCTIITTRPNELMRDIHDRMPAIIPPDSYDRWLTSKEPPDSLRELLDPLPADQLEAHQVSTRVNRVGTNDPDCILPDKEKNLFD